MQTRPTFHLVFALLLGAIAALIADPSPARAAGPYAAPKDKALVYVIQGPTGRFANLAVSVNGRPLQYLTANSYFAFLVSPGVQQISTAAAGRTVVSLVVASGATYFLRISVNSQDLPEIVQLDDVQGGNALSRARQVGDRPIGAGAKRMTSTAAARRTPPPAAKAPEPEAERAAPESSRSELPNTIILKAGTYKMSKGTQDFLSATRTFDTKSKSVWGAEYEYRVWRGVAVGAEYGQFKNSFTSSGTSVRSNMDVKLFLVKAKKYFEMSDLFQPYVGVGVGAAWANFDGAVTGDTVGAAYEAVGGMDFRFKYVGVYTELRYLSSTTSGKQKDTDNTVDVHVTGSGAFAGVSFHF
jgi:hypothetical protein